MYIVFEILLIWLGVSGGLNWLMEATTRVANAFITMSGLETTVSGNEIFLSKRILYIGLDCTAIYVLAVYTALILAYPTGWRPKVYGIAAGTPAILFLNVLRLVGVAHVAEKWPNAFEVVHDYSFQVGMMFMTIVLWVVWMTYEHAYSQRSRQ